MTSVHDAIEAHINNLPLAKPGDDPGILGDWLAIACMVDVDAEGHPRAEYYLLMRDGTLLPHVAAGLIDQASIELEARTSGGEDA